jgi:hypothetical protein
LGKLCAIRAIKNWGRIFIYQYAKPENALIFFHGFLEVPDRECWRQIAPLTDPHTKLKKAVGRILKGFNFIASAVIRLGTSVSRYII